MYTYIYSFSNSFPILVIAEYWADFPGLKSRSLFIIYFKYKKGMYVNPKLKIYPFHLFPLVTISFSESMNLFPFYK